MTIDRSKKDALAHVPGAGSTLYEEQGKATRAGRYNGGGLEQLGDGPMAALRAGPSSSTGCSGTLS